MKRIVCALALAALAAGPAHAQAFKAEGKSLRQIYEHFHANPELSLQEKNSSAIMAAEAKRLGFQVTTGLGDAWIKARAMKEYGKVEPGVGGYGVVAVMRNGQGPTLMIRADMDGLPVEEKTGLPYASKRRAVQWSGEEAPIMHACGHDIHMTAWIGAARELVARKAEWKGTLVMIAEPAEEIGLGSKAMLEDGLFTRFPKPDYVLALHDSPTLAGQIGLTPGYAMANVDSVDITVKGIGGHGAYPHTAKDPIVVAARIVGALQTLVSRELDPFDSGVVTVGAFNAGAKHNIIPEEAKLQITVRSFADTTRKMLLDGIARIARAEALAAGLEGALAPVVLVREGYTFSLYNDPKLIERVGVSIRKAVGEANVVTATPSMAGEDFANYGRTDDKIPITLFWVGAIKKDDFEASQKPGGKPLPALHSAYFAPDPDPTLAAGVKAMTAAAMDILK